MRQHSTNPFPALARSVTVSRFSSHLPSERVDSWHSALFGLGELDSVKSISASDAFFSVSESETGSEFVRIEFALPLLVFLAVDWLIATRIIFRSAHL